MHTLVREFAEEELAKEDLDKNQLLVRAAQYYENRVKVTENLWDLLMAREYYYRAEEWGKAHEIRAATHEYLVRWGYMELAMNLLNESINTTTGVTKAAAMGNLATILHSLGDWVTAVKLHTEVKEIFENEGQDGNVAVALHQLGMIHQDQGNYDEAARLYQQSLKINEELGDKSGIASTLGQLGRIHQAQENYEEAARLYQQSLKINEELGDKSGIASTLGQLGRLHEEQDADYPAALEKYHQARLIFRELHSPDAAIAENDIARLKETMGEEAFSEAMEDIRGKYGA